MKKSSSLLVKRSFKLAANNIWRNKVLSLATVFVTGTIIFIFNIILAVNFIAQDALNDLNQKIDITVYLKESTSYEQSQNLLREIQNFDGVTEVTYTSKEQALENLKLTHPNITLAFEQYDLENPLPASINIATEHPQYHQAIAQNLQQDRFRAAFSNLSSADPRENSIVSGVAKNLVELSNFTHQVIFWLIIVFVLGGALVILNALQITIFNRKKEISVMKLVGASLNFIRAPFMIESVIYGLTAVLISFIMLFILSQNIEIQTTSLWSYYSNIQFVYIFLVELLITVLLSAFSSYIAVHEYIHEKL